MALVNRTEATLSLRAWALLPRLDAFRPVGEQETTHECQLLLYQATYGPSTSQRLECSRSQVSNAHAFITPS